MRIFAFAVLLNLVLFACGGCGKAPTKDTKVVLQLKWVYNAGFVGDLVAQEKGFWKEQGLKVEVRPGGVGVAPIKVVTAGDAQFGIATGDQVLLAAEEGTPILAITLAYQDNPLVWITRTSSGINSAKDFKGKKIGLTFIDDEPLFNAMMARVGLDPKRDVQIVPVKFDTSPFFRGEVDAFPVYKNTQGVEIEAELSKRGIKTRMIGPASEGIVSYSNLYFVTKDYEKRQPEIVRAFVNGVLKGWAYANDHPDEAAQIVAKYDKETKTDIIKLSVVATNALVKPNPTDRIGKMTTDGWLSTEKVLLLSRQLKRQVDVNTVFVNKYVQ